MGNKQIKIATLLLGSLALLLVIAEQPGFTAENTLTLDSPFAEMDFEIANCLDFLPHTCAKNGSPPTCFTHLLADQRITLAEWGSNPVLRPFLKPK